MNAVIVGILLSLSPNSADGVRCRLYDLLQRLEANQTEVPANLADMIGVPYHLDIDPWCGGMDMSTCAAELGIYFA